MIRVPFSGQCLQSIQTKYPRKRIRFTRQSTAAPFPYWHHPFPSPLVSMQWCLNPYPLSQCQTNSFFISFLPDHPSFNKKRWSEIDEWAVCDYRQGYNYEPPRSPSPQLQQLTHLSNHSLMANKGPQLSCHSASLWHGDKYEPWSWYNVLGLQAYHISILSKHDIMTRTMNRQVSQTGSRRH